MTDTILEIAAYVCLGIGVAVLLYRALGARVQRRFGIWRFDREVSKLDGVPDHWVAQWASEQWDKRSGDPLPRRRQRRLSDER